MAGKYLSQETKLVLALPPVDVGGVAKVSDAFKMSDNSHATIFVATGVVTNTATITVNASSDAAQTGATAIPFTYRKTGVANDTLGAKVEATATGFATGTDNTVLHVIEIDARQLPAGLGWLSVHATNAAAALITAIAVLSGTKYQGETIPTAIA